MSKLTDITASIRNQLLNELNQDIEESFGGNKTMAAEAVEMNRVSFTNVCNGRESATIDKLIKIGAKLGWNIEVQVDRDKGK